MAKQLKAYMVLQRRAQSAITKYKGKGYAPAVRAGGGYEIFGSRLDAFEHATSSDIVFKVNITPVVVLPTVNTIDTTKKVEEKRVIKRPTGERGIKRSYKLKSY